MNLPEEKRNGWVGEQLVSQATGKPPFGQRVEEAGLGALLGAGGPRAQCRAIAQAADVKNMLLDENAKRLILNSIAKTWISYVSGIKCWAAFCDAIGCSRRFPATESSRILKYAGVFKNAATFAQYLKHLRWAHRVLKMDPSQWSTATVKQAERGLAKAMPPSLPKVALKTVQVREMVRLAESVGKSR